jgi:hypothetical protein
METGGRGVFCIFLIGILTFLHAVPGNQNTVVFSTSEDVVRFTSNNDQNQFGLASMRYEGELENGVEVQGYLDNEEGVYWNISANDGALQGIINLECLDYAYYIKGYCNGQWTFSTTRAGSREVAIIRKPFWIGVWEIHILPQRPNQYGRYNISVTFNYDSISVDDEPSVVWRKDLKFSDRIWMTSITECVNEGFLAAGALWLNLTDEGSTIIPEEPTEHKYQARLFLLRIDDEGNSLWNRTFETKIRGSPFVCTLSDGSFIIADNIKGEEEWKGPIHILHINSSGQVMWDSYIEGDGWYLRDLVPVGDSGFLILADNLTLEDERYVSVGTVFHMASNGTELWRFNTTNPSINDYLTQDESKDMIAISASETPDGQMVICGNLFPDSSIPRGWLALLNKDGSLEWGTALDNQYAMSVSVFNSTVFAVVGYSVEAHNCISTQYLTLDGQLVNSFTYFHDLNLHLREVIPKTDSGLVYLMEYDTIPTQTSFALFCTDNSGNVIWCYEHPRDAYPAHLASYPNGDIMVITYTYSSWDESKTLLLRISDSIGLTNPLVTIMDPMVISIVATGVGTMALVVLVIILKKQDSLR